MPDILGRVRTAIKPDRPVKNAKTFLRTFVAKGPFKAIVDGSEAVWSTNMERIDDVVGSQLSRGGPIQ